jgi:hypothetical protein
VAKLPSAEESARAILAIFNNHHARPGRVMMSGAVNLAFLADGGGRTPEEYSQALRYAETSGWLEATSSGIRLTDAGFAQM